jgi:molybdate transport system ATP-binding protein
MILRLTNLLWRAPDFDLRLDAEITAPRLGLFGESGAGKTTVLNLIAGLLVPLEGRIEFDGQLFCDGSSRREALPARSRRVGYVPQDRALFPHLSVRDNIQYGAGSGPPRDDLFSLDHVTAVLEIGALLDRTPSSLSGGEQQRVAIARALLSRPRLLLLDEPLSGLDDNRRIRALALLRRVLDEFQLPMIYVSHSAREVAQICDEVLVMERGRVMGRGLPDLVFEEAGSPELRVRENFPPRGNQS